MPSQSLSRLRLVQVAFTRSPSLRYSALLIMPTLVSLIFALTPYSKLSSLARFIVYPIEVTNFGYLSVPTTLSKFLRSEAHIYKILLAGLGLWILPAAYSIFPSSAKNFPMWTFIPMFIWFLQQTLFMWWIIRKTFQEERIAAHMVPNNPAATTGRDPHYPGSADQCLPRLKDLNLSLGAPIAPKISQGGKLHSSSFCASNLTKRFMTKELVHVKSSNGLLPKGFSEPQAEVHEGKFKFEVGAVHEVMNVALKPPVSFAYWNEGSDCLDTEIISNKWCDDGTAQVGVKDGQSDKKIRDRGYIPTLEGPEGEEQRSDDVSYVPCEPTWGRKRGGFFLHSRRQSAPSIFVGAPTEFPSTAQPLPTAQPDQPFNPVSKPVRVGSVTYQPAAPLSQLFRNHHVAFLYYFAMYFFMAATLALCTCYFVLFSVFSSAGVQSIFLVLFPIMVLGYRTMVLHVFIKRLHHPVLAMLWYLAADFYPKTFRAFAYVSIRDPKVFIVAFASEVFNVTSPLLPHLLNLLTTSISRLGLRLGLRLRVSPSPEPPTEAPSYSTRSIRRLISAIAPPGPSQRQDHLSRDVLQATLKSLSTIVSIFGSVVTMAAARFGPAQDDFPFSPIGLPHDDYVRGTAFALIMLATFVAGHVISSHVVMGLNDRSRKAVERSNLFIGRHTVAMLGVMVPGVVIPSFIFPRFQSVFFRLQPSRYPST